MLRLLVHVEGQTEEAFVNELLCEHLLRFGFSLVSARIVGNPRKQRGGIRLWEAVRKDITRHLKNDPGAIATTMVDYYALPHSGLGGQRLRARIQPLRKLCMWNRDCLTTLLTRWGAVSTRGDLFRWS